MCVRSGCAAAAAAATAASAAATTAVAPGKCESRVTEYRALEYARGLPPVSHNPGSWRNKADCASTTGAAIGAAASASAAATTVVAPGKCESRVTEHGVLEYARGLPPLFHNPGSWGKGAGCASATSAATGAATDTQCLEMGGTVSRTRGVRGAAQAVRGARTACWGGGRKAAERTQAVTSRRKTNSTAISEKKKNLSPLFLPILGFLAIVTWVKYFIPSAPIP